MAGPPRKLPVYSIGTVEKLTGLTARQIRYYETKGLIAPARTKGRQRMYSQDQVDRLLAIKRLMNEGYSLKSIVELLSGEGEGASRLDALEGYQAGQRLERPGLRSLYPVTDHPLLMRLLERREEER